MSNKSPSVVQVLTSAEMAATDSRTSTEFGIPLVDLMDAAGGAIARFCLRRYPQANRVAVLCGKGNNGGDGLVCARGMAGAGKDVRVYLLGALDELRGLPMEQMARLKELTPPVTITELKDDDAVTRGLREIEAADLLVDAIVGTGFKPPLRGIAARLRDAIAGMPIPVVAADLPSGWDADSMAQSFTAPESDEEHGGGGRAAFRADAVVTFTAPKLAHVFGHLTPGRTFGPVVVAPIGSPEAAISSGQRLTWTGTAKKIAEPPRNVNSNKGRFGHVLVVGGSFGKSGAPSMSGLAALRTGAGLVTAAVPESILTAVAGITPELMTMPLKQDSAGSVSLENLEPKRLEHMVKGIKVLAIGPGLSTEGDARAFARGLVERTSFPTVIDADALNAFAGKTQFLKAAASPGQGGARRDLVLTPHPGEMARLLGVSISEVEADRIGVARKFATEHGLTLVLKGWRTLVAHPDGRVAVNTTGNPAMAKGGSGDILTGIVAAMIAQFPDDVPNAVEAAVYLHGLAGDFAALEKDEHTVLATDTLAHLSNAFRYRTEDADGLTWICGVQGEG